MKWERLIFMDSDLPVLSNIAQTSCWDLNKKSDACKHIARGNDYFVMCLHSGDEGK